MKKKKPRGRPVETKNAKRRTIYIEDKIFLKVQKFGGSFSRGLYKIMENVDLKELKEKQKAS